MKHYLLVLILELVACSGFGQKKSVSETYLNNGVQAYEKSDYELAVDLFEKAVTASKESGEDKVLTMAYNNLGNTLSQTGQPERAMKQYLNGIALAREHHDVLQIAKTSKNIGTLYSEQKDFKSAMQYYKEALGYANELKNQALIADCLNNMGVVHEQQLDYPKAIIVYSKALKIYRSQADEQRISMTLNNLAIVYKCLKEYPKAIKNYEASLVLSEKLGDKFMVAANQNNLGNAYAEIGNYKETLRLCLLSNKNAKDIGASEIVIESYGSIASAYEKLGQFQQAIAFRKLYEEEKEKFINSERSAQIAEMEVKYGMEKKEDEIRLLQQQDKIKTLEISGQKFQIERRTQLLVLFIILLLALLIATYYWKSRRKLQAKIVRENIIRETEELERIRIAKDIHDDLGSGLSKINFLSEIILRDCGHLPETKSSTEAVKETAALMIENMRDLIWALHPENTTLESLLARMREYAADYLEDLPMTIHFSFPEFLPQTIINKESHRELYMFTKEVLNNIAKHANATKLDFSVAVTNESLAISISDNGIGFDTKSISEGNGLRNMQSRIKSVGGTMEMETAIGNGTQIKAIVPLQEICK